jgi:hypothetical protein
MSTLAAKSARLENFAQNQKVIDRLVNAPDSDGQELAADIHSAPSGENPHGVGTKIYKFGTISAYVYTYELDGVLVVTVPIIKSEGLGMGDRKKSLDPSFGKLLAAIIEGTRRRVVSDPNVYSVKFVGRALKSESLQETLSELGFSSPDKGSVLKKIGLPLLAAGLGTFAAASSNSNEIAALAVTSATVGAVYIGLTIPAKVDYELLLDARERPSN